MKCPQFVVQLDSMRFIDGLPQVHAPLDGRLDALCAGFPACEKRYRLVLLCNDRSLLT